MSEQIAARLDQLRNDYELGEVRLRQLIQNETGLRETLLRISGAIQVLEELLADDGGSGGASPSSTNGQHADGARAVDGEPGLLRVPC